MPTLHQDPGPLQTSCFKGGDFNFELNYSVQKKMMSLSSFNIPSDPVPEIDKLNIFLSSELHSAFPPLRREGWE